MSLPPGPHVDESSRWVGRLIASRYRLLRVVGVGGHGAVYEARHELTGRRFAVKLLLSDPRSIRGLAERLVREAKATSRVTHPNVVEVIDVGVDAESERLYLIEELLEGDDLRARMRARRRMSTQEVRAVIGPVLDGLGAAHAQGVVHRDLKPSNVFVSPDDDVKLGDFGLAVTRWADEAPLVDQLMGTPPYMAPEQAEPRSVDHRCDLYALGCIVYEMLTGAPPFPGTELVEVLLRHERDPVPPLPTTVPPGVVAVVMKLLAKRPDGRPESAAAVVASLSRLLGEREGWQRWVGR